MCSTIRLDKNVDMPMRDGTVLRGDVWRLDDEEARPAIVERTPYQKERSTGHDFLRPDVMAAAGYVVVVQDTRGRFASDGEFVGIDWQQEAKDAYDTVEWVAEQTWCDGNVALWGASYPGTVTWLGALQRPPHLKAIAPAMTADAQTGAAASGGGFLLELMANWVVMQLASDVLPKQVAAGTVTPETVEKLTEAMRDPSVLTDYLPWKKTPHLDVPGNPVSLDELAAGQTGPTPGAFDWSQIEVPALLVTGWFDPFASIDQFSLLRQRGGGGDAVRSAHRLVVGPWVHANQLGSAHGEVNFGLGGNGRVALGPAYLSFFDRHLRGVGDGGAATVRYFLMGANEWRDADVWPPAHAVARRWYLSSSGAANTAGGDGVLDDRAACDGAADRFFYDPMNPVRTHGGRVVPIGRSVAGPLNQQHLESRDDVLCFTSPPLTEMVDVVGPVTVRLFASSSALDTDFVAKLVDVFPDGRSVLVCDGMRRVRFRDGYVEERLLEPGEVVELEVNLGHTAWRFSAGHRLRVDVTSSNFPHLDRNMNTGNGVGDDETGVIAEQTVFHDAQRPSRLEVLVLS